jgi:hypothetical protein
VIERRLRLGDFEGDTVLGPPGTGGLATLVCRKSRLTIIAKVQSKNADHVHAKLKQRLNLLSAGSEGDFSAVSVCRSVAIVGGCQAQEADDLGMHRR